MLTIYSRILNKVDNHIQKTSYHKKVQQKVPTLERFGLETCRFAGVDAPLLFVYGSTSMRPSSAMFNNRCGSFGSSDSLGDSSKAVMPFGKQGGESEL